MINVNNILYLQTKSKEVVLNIWYAYHHWYMCPFFYKPQWKNSGGIKKRTQTNCTHCSKQEEEVKENTDVVSQKVSLIKGHINIQNRPLQRLRQIGQVLSCVMFESIRFFQF